MRQTTLIKIVSLLRRNLDTGHTIMSISKELKIGYRPAYTHIIQMEKEGIINIQKVGNSKLCKINLQNLRARYILGEIRMHLPKLDLLIDKILEKNISDICSIVLFGSYAKGTFTKKSDVDILFIVRNRIIDIEKECAKYSYANNLEINPVTIFVKDFAEMLLSNGTNLAKEVKRDGVVIYGSELFWLLISNSMHSINS